jgi:hypothetical protein
LLQIDKNLFEEKEKEIKILTSLIKKQKEKIVEVYLKFAPEKELLRKLINARLEYAKARKQKISLVKFRQQFDVIQRELAEKLNKEKMEEVGAILNDCELLVDLELEIEAKFSAKSFTSFGEQLAVNTTVINFS